MKTFVVAFVCYFLVTTCGFCISYSIALQPGLNLIANQLDDGSNTLDEIMPVVPDGSVVYKYDNNNSAWDSSTYSAASGSWGPASIIPAANSGAYFQAPTNFTISLAPGEGAFFQAPSNFTLTLTGTPRVPVLPVSIPGGACYLVSRQTNDVGNYTNIVGSEPSDGTTAYQWNGSGYDSYQYESAAGGWVDNSSGLLQDPMTAVGEALWISPSGTPPPVTPQSYQLALQPGLNLIANQLDHGSNTLDEIMPVVPDGSVVYKYDNNNGAWDSSTYSAASGSWGPASIIPAANSGAYFQAPTNFTISLAPGEGAFFQAPSNFTLTLTGTPRVPVLPVSIPGGACYLVSRQTNDVGNYTNIVGSEPSDGTTAYQWNGSGYDSYQYESAAGGWVDNSSGLLQDPMTAVGEALWISPSGTPPPVTPQSYQLALQPGLNLIANQLDHGSNTLDEIMPVVPDGSVVYKYDNNNGAWDSSTYSAASGSWGPASIIPAANSGAYFQAPTNFTISLAPGEGAFFQAPSNFTLTLTGTPRVPVLPVSIPGGACYLVSRQTNDVGNYTNIVGSEPSDGTTAYQWNGSGYDSYQYESAAGGWVDNSSGLLQDPMTAVGEALWISPSGTPPPVTPQSYQLALQPGLNLIANQLDHGSNTLDEIMPVVPDGSVVYKYDNNNGAWDSSTYSAASGSWGPASIIPAANSGAYFQAPTNFTISLAPGEGAFFQAPSNFTLTLTGTPRVPVLPVSIPGGACYLVSRQTNDVGNYTNIVGSEPSDGTTAYQWNGSGYDSYQYESAAGGWVDNSSGLLQDPMTAVGEALWISPSGSPPPGLPQSYQLNLPVGLSLIANQLDNGNNALTNIFPPGTLPDGSEILLWNCSSFDTYLSDSTSPSGWDDGDANPVDVSGVGLAPGEAFFINPASNLTLKFVGVPHDPVLPANLPCGDGMTNYLACQTNAPGTYANIIGLSLVPGAQEQIWNGTSFTVYTYINRAWTPVTPPALAVGQGAVFIVPNNATTVSLVYQGLTNTSLGNTSLFVYQGLTNTGHGYSSIEVISNLSSGGQDGVSISLPASLTSLDVNWLPLDPSNSLPVGAYLQESIVGNTDNGTGQLLGTVTLTKLCADCGGDNPSNIVMTADFNWGTTTNYGYAVQAYLRGVLVGQATNQSGSLLAYCESLPQSGCIPTTLGGGWDWTNETLVTFADGVGVPCDHLYVLPENLPGTSTALQITASQIPVITITSENEGLVYQGLTNTSLGNASLFVYQGLTNTGHGYSSIEVISNLSSGGQDGVSISLPASLTSLDVNWLPLDPSNSLPVGAYLQESIVGNTGNATNEPLGTVTMTKLCADCGEDDPGNIVMTADFNWGTTTNYGYAVQAYLHGVLVGQATNQSGSMLAYCESLPQSGCIPTTLGGGWDWTNETSVTFADGVGVPCDHLYVLPENLAGTSTALQITASQIPVITITSENEGLVYQGLTNTSLGNASLFVYQGLTNTGHGYSSIEVISNLSSGGQDGVSITVSDTKNITDGAAQGQATDLTVAWQPLDESNTLPVGAYLQSQAIGTAYDITNGILGTLTETKAGTSIYDITADYSALGAGTYTAQVYYQGTLMAQVTNQSGVSFATVNILPNGKNLGDIITPLSDEWADGEGVILSIDETNVPCDQLIVTPNGVTVTNPSALQIVASGIPSITITGENETSPSVPSLVYQGLTNTSLGNASLFVYQGLTNTGHGYSSIEVISNLSSGGQDGVSISLPASLTSLDVNWLPLDPSNSLPVGAYLQESIVGNTDNGTGQLLGTVTLTKLCADCGGDNPSNIVMTADFNWGTTTNYGYAVQAYLRGVLVGQATNQSGSLLAYCESLPQSGCIPTTLGGGWDWTNETLVTFADGVGVPCDHLYVLPENLPGTSTALQITASQIPVITITSENEGLVYQGLTNTSLGNASLFVYQGLTNTGHGYSSIEVISNLSSGGQDGVSISLPASLTSLDVNWLPLDPSNSLPVGAYLQESIVGNTGNATNEPLGTVTMTKLCADCGEDSPINIVMTADFNWGTTTNYGYAVQAYLHGVLVGQATNQIGAALVTMSAMPLSAGFESNPNALSWVVEWSTNPVAMDLYEPDTNLETSTTISVSCDQLVITPQNVTLKGTPAALQIMASQVPSINIMATTVSPWILSLGLNPQHATLQWYGAGALQGSADLTAWSDITNATSPYNVTALPSQPNKFYRLVFNPR